MGRFPIGLRETSWATFAGALQSLAPFVAFLILARLASPEELGRYSLAVGVVVPLFLVARMQLRQAAVADPQGGESFGAYRKLRLIAASLALGAICISALLFERETAVVVATVALVRWAEDFADIHYAPLQRASLWRRITASQLVRLSGALLILPVGWRLVGLPGALTCVALWQLGVTVCWDLPSSRRLESVRVKRTEMLRLLRLNWPLGATAAVVSLMSYVPRYALAWTGDETAVGDYAALGQIALLGNLVVQGAGQAALGRLGATFVGKRAQFVRIVRGLLLLAGAVGAVSLLGAALWGDLLLAFIFQPRFAGLSLALVGMTAAALCVYVTSVFGYALTAAGVKAQQLSVFCAALAVGTVSSFLLSAAYGVTGAVAGNACGWAAAAVFSGLLLRRVCGAAASDDSSAVPGPTGLAQRTRAV